MATSVDFQGTNTRLLGGADDVEDMTVFRNGKCVVSCWQLTPEELEEVKRTGMVWLSVFSGPTSPPVCVGSEEIIRDLVGRYGGAWPRQTS